ncbi:MAG: response regulator [Gammaproteobacteria bacterium]|nr:response regulator [Gammaproteobacteria bacterium]
MRSFRFPADAGELRSVARGVAVVELDLAGSIARERWAVVGSAIATMLLLLGVVVAFLTLLYFMMRSSIRELTDVATDLASGNYSRRAESFRLVDLDAAGNAFNSMSGAISGALANIEESRERYRSLVDLAADAIVTIDAQSRIVGFNRAAEKLFGYAMTELIGQSLLMLMPKAAAGRHDAWVDGYQKGARSLEAARTLHGLTRDGRVIDIEVSVSSLKTRDGMLHTSIIRDVTQRRARDLEIVRYRDQLEQVVAERTGELAQQRDLAEAATRAKSEFLANMSHEVRTPMNAIIGMTHLALGTELDERQRNFIAKIQVSAQHLLTIINDILDFSKIEAGKMTIEQASFKLGDLFEKLSSLIADKCAQKGLELVIRVDPEVPPMVRGDALRISQALLNYVNNAIKFTETGSIEIRVRRTGAADGYCDLRFEVKDTGIGISAEDQLKLFNSFTQADNSTTRKFGGTGLGLVITRQLARMMDGDAGFSSELGQGSTFWFSVRVGLIASDRSAAADALMSSLIMSRALVVDDNLSARMVMTGLLEELGIIVEAVPSAEVALARIATRECEGQAFRFAFIDWRMPGMDGVELAERLGQLALKSPPRIVMITAFGRDELAVAARNAPHDAVLVKPVHQAALFGVFERLLGNAGSAVAIAVNEKKRATADTARDFKVRIGGTKVLVVEDNLINQEVALELLREVGIEAEIAEHGRRALQLLEEKRYDVVLMDMHMPVMDGLETARAIRRRSDWNSLPIIAVTGNAMESDRDLCFAAGMNDHLSKPMNPSDLWAKIDRWKSGLVETASTAANSLAVAAPSATFGRDFDRMLSRLVNVNVGAGLQRAAGLAKLYVGVLEKFALAHPHFVREFAAARAAGEAEQLLRHLHTLRGSAGAVGAERLSARLDELESLLRGPSAPAELLDASLAAVATELSVVLKGIGAALAVRDSASAESASGGRDTANMTAVMARLGRAFADNDPSAIMLLRDEHDLLAASLRSHFAQICVAADNFDFELAAKLLQDATRQNPLSVGRWLPGLDSNQRPAD